MIAVSLAFLVTMAASSPEDRVGPKIPELERVAGDPYPTTEYSRVDVLKANRLFGSCVVRRQPKRATEYLLSPGVKPNLEHRRKLREAMNLGDCLGTVVRGSSLGVSMEFPGETLSYALAEPLVRMTFGQAPILEFVTVPPLEHPTFDESEYVPKKKATAEEVKTLEEIKSAWLGAVFLSGFGECVVRTDPANSFALIMTEMGSPEEKVRMKALGSALSGCLQPGRQLRFTRPLIRGTIAHNYFRLASAARARQAEAGVR